MLNVDTRRTNTQLLPIVLALRTWRHYLEGNKFSVVCKTDHRPLVHFMRNHQERGRLVRWQQFLTHFNLQVSHVAGKSNSFADGLSRLPQVSLMLASTTLQLDPLMHDISESQKNDPHGTRDCRHAGGKVDDLWAA
jgi:hypothetical protein